MSSAGATFVWPEDLEELIYVLVRADLVERRRKRAAARLTGYVLTYLTRRWFVLRKRPLLWPHGVAMYVSWRVLRAAPPGSLIFGQRVRPGSPWQHLLVASAHRMAHRRDLWPECEAQSRGSVHAHHYVWKYILKRD